MADALEFEVTADTKSAEASFERLSGDLDELDKEIRAAAASGDRLTFDRAAQSARSLKQAADSSARALKNKRRSMGLAVNEVTEFIGPMGAAVGISGTFSSAVQAAGNSVVGLSAALGPLGIAIGLVAGLLPEVIRWYKEWTGSTEEAKSAQDRLAESVSRVNALFDQQRQTQAQALEASLGANLERINRLNQQIAENQSRIRDPNLSARERSQRGEIVDILTRQRDAIREQNAALQTQRERLQDVGDEIESNSARGGRRASPRQEGVTDEDLLRSAAGTFGRGSRGDEISGIINPLIQEQEDPAQARIESFLQRNKLQREYNALVGEQAERQASAAAAQERALVAQRRQVEAQVQANQAAQAFQTLSGATVATLVSGEKNLGQALLETIQIELANLATRNAFLGAEALAVGIGLSTLQPKAAADKFAAAAKHFAIAGAAGGGSAAVGAASGGGGGGGQPAPDRQTGGGGEGGDGGPTTVVINFNSPTNEALQGRQFEQAQRAARRRFGR